MRKRDAREIYEQYNFKGVDFNKIGCFLGEGVHGCAYRYNKDKVIKFSYCDYNDGFEGIKKMIRIVRRYKALPKIYSYGGNDHMYWVVMEYLPGKVTKQYDHVIDTLIKVVFGYRKSSSLCGKWRSLASSLERLRKKHGYFYEDLHRDNVRFNKQGEPKVIDLESFYFLGNEEMPDY